MSNEQPSRSEEQLHQEQLLEGQLRNKKSYISPSTSLSDSGFTSSPASESISGTMFSPPTLARCATDSPSHYFLRGTHRWSSTPLIKVPGLGRSMSIPMSSTPAVFNLSPPVATSTPDNLQSGVVGKTELNRIPEMSGISSFIDYSSTTESGSKLVRTPEKVQISSLAQLGPLEFQKRIQDNLDKTDIFVDNLDKTTGDAVETSSSQATDSGIGSLLQSPFKDRSCEESRAAVLPKLRRSPRQLALSVRLDRCSRILPDHRLKLRSLRSESYVEQPGLYLGIDRVDLLRHLSERDIWETLERILSYLSPGDLCSVAIVSPHWRKILESRVLQDQRRKTFVLDKKLNRENLGEVLFRTRTSPRLAMQEVNRNLSPSTKRNRSETSREPQTSPNKIRNRLFTDSPVLSTDRLLHCPNCSASSLVSIIKKEGEEDGSGLELGTCSSKSCGLVFCGNCMYSEHPGKPCRFLQMSAKSRSSVVSSKKSKARLRRL